jgi:hypothetical protein
MGRPKLNFEIKPEIFDELLIIQDELPSRAIRETVVGGAPAYDHPAGMALLGMKDDIVDTVVGLKMSGGCWDAPNINFEDMDKGLQKLIKEDRICAGMALVRHPAWQSNKTDFDAKIPNQLKSQLHNMRNSFADITKTAWIVVHNDYFRVYRPTKGQDGRVGCAEVSIKSLFSDEAKENKLISSKLQRDETRKERIVREKREAAEARAAEKVRLAAQIEAEKKQRAAEEEAERKRQEKIQAKVKITNSKFKEAKEDIIDAGGGYVFMKNKKGEYILWQTGR